MNQVAQYRPEDGLATVPDCIQDSVAAALSNLPNMVWTLSTICNNIQDIEAVEPIMVLLDDRG